MPTNKPRFMVTISQDMKERIDDYHHEHRCKNQTQAINELIERGLAVLASEEKQQKKEPANLDGLGADAIAFEQGVRNLSPQNRRLLLGILALMIQGQEQPSDSPP